MGKLWVALVALVALVLLAAARTTRKRYVWKGTFR